MQMSVNQIFISFVRLLAVWTTAFCVLSLCKRPCFAGWKTVFYTAKGRVLLCGWLSYGMKINGKRLVVAAIWHVFLLFYAVSWRVFGYVFCRMSVEGVLMQEAQPLNFVSSEGVPSLFWHIVLWLMPDSVCRLKAPPFIIGWDYFMMLLVSVCCQCFLLSDDAFGRFKMCVFNKYLRWRCKKTPKSLQMS